MNTFDSKVKSMDPPQAVLSQPEGEKHQGISNPLTLISAQSRLDPDGVDRSTFEALSPDRDRRIRASRLEVAVTATALGLLLVSLLGENYSVVAFVLVAVFCVGTRVAHPVLHTVAALTLAVNVFVLPTLLARSASGSVTWIWIPLWCLEGLLVNWLLVVLFRVVWDQSETLSAFSTSTEVGHCEPGTAQLLIESSSQSQERVRLMVESIRNYAIVMLDPHGCVASWNVGAERILGYQASEILGRNHEQFHVAEDVGLKIPQRSLETAGAEGKFDVEGWRRRKDDTRLWAHVGVTPVRSATGDSPRLRNSHPGHHREETRGRVAPPGQRRTGTSRERSNRRARRGQPSTTRRGARAHPG